LQLLSLAPLQVLQVILQEAQRAKELSYVPSIQGHLKLGVGLKSTLKFAV